MKCEDVKIIISDTQPAEVDKKKSNGSEGDDGYCFSFNGWIGRLWLFAMEDPKRVTFSLKVGLALILVSMLILFRATYDIFRVNIIWSIMTVAIMFEYTVGATLNKGFNRAVGSLLAGIFAVVVIQIAITSGHVAEPYVFGFSIFFIGALTSFMKLWPSFAPYEYGFRVTLFTYCLIVASAYRMGNPIRTAMDRLYSIAIGGLVAVLVNVLVFPIWSGEQLHQELVKWFNLVADSLEECVNMYVKYDGTEQPEFDKTVMDDFPDEPAFKKCWEAMNSSSSKLDSLANSAKWEPPHGNFRHFFYPWPEYVKVGAVLRHCAYEVMVLHGCLHSEIQAPYNLRVAFQREILETATKAAELVRTLGQDIRDMNHRAHSNLLKQVHFSVEQLQKSINLHSYLLTSTSFKKLTTTITISSNLNGDESLKKQQRRLYSWPSGELDDDVDGDEIPKMRTLESTSALSLATFTSLLIEFVARLAHLVDAVDELARMAKFKEHVVVKN